MASSVNLTVISKPVKRYIKCLNFYFSPNAQNFAKYLQAMRVKYLERKEVLLEKSIKVKDPMYLFRKWWQEARKLEAMDEAHAACLATVNKDGIPTNRFILLRDVTAAGFVFFTNYGSRKAEDIASNPNVSLSFYWFPMSRSVRIEGVAEKIPHERSLTFFYRQPRVTQIATLASEQSSKVMSRNYMDKFEAGVKATLGPKAAVPMPNWGGYLIRPHAIEFYQGPSDLMPDRIRFRRGANVEKEIDNNLVHKGENGWVYERLAP